MTLPPTTPGTDLSTPPAGNSFLALERRSWQNWLLTMGVLFLTVLGLGTSILSLFDLKPDSAWPWPKTDVLLLGAFSVMILAFLAYLTRQQRHLMAARRDLAESREQAAAQLTRHVQHLNALRLVTHTLASRTDPQEVFDRIVEVGLETFGGEQASLMLFDGAEGDLEVRAAVGHDDECLVLGSRRAVGAGVAGWVAQHREPLLLGPQVDSTLFADFVPSPVRLSTAMIMPILLREELVGVMSVASRAPGASYDNSDLQAFSVFAEGVGVCIRHTEQAKWLRSAMQAGWPPPNTTPETKSQPDTTRPVPQHRAA